MSGPIERMLGDGANNMAEVVLGLGADLAKAGVAGLTRAAAGTYNAVGESISSAITSAGNTFTLGGDSRLEPSVSPVRQASVEVPAHGHDHEIGRLTPTHINLAKTGRDSQQTMLG